MAESVAGLKVWFDQLGKGDQEHVHMTQEIPGSHIIAYFLYQCSPSAC